MQGAGGRVDEAQERRVFAGAGGVQRDLGLGQARAEGGGQGQQYSVQGALHFLMLVTPGALTISSLIFLLQAR